MLCIPEHVARQLDLQTESVREVSVADGRTATVPYVGPVKVAFGTRFCYVGALVIGDEVLLGSVPMEDMDLVVNPARRQLTVDPASPNVPHAASNPRHATEGTAVGVDKWLGTEVIRVGPCLRTGD